MLLIKVLNVLLLRLNMKSDHRPLNMNSSISALVTNYNTWSLTALCAKELEKWSKDHLTQIVVVDDDSEYAPPRNLPEKVRLVQNSVNKGYVASINIGFASIKENIVIVLDSDAYPLMDLASPLIEKFSNNPNLGAVGFKLVDEKGTEKGSFSPEPTVLGLLLGQQLYSTYQSWFPKVNSSAICLHSCGMATRRVAFEEVGGFDEGFDFLDADVDFSTRLRLAGWQIEYDSNLVAYHQGSGSPQTTAKRVLRYHRNRWRFLKKHGCLSYPELLKVGLATRHLIEYSTLLVGGKFLMPDSNQLSDKLYSRKQLIKNVWNEYNEKKV